MATPYEDSFEEVNPQDSTPQDNTTTPDKDYSEDFEQIEDLQDKQKDLVPATSKTKEDKIKKANEEDPEEKPEDEETESNNPLVDKFSTFFNKYYKSKIEKLIEDFPKHRSLNVDFGLVEQFDPDLADELIENSEFCFEAMQQVVMNFQSTLIGEVKEKEFDPFVRIINIPKDKRILIKNVSSRHLGKFISIEGIVKQFTTVLPKLKIAHWICKKCGTELNLHQDGFEIIKPKMCPECKHRDFFLDEKRSVFLDYQKLEMQELLEELKGGEQTSTINIFVFGDLVNTFTAGARLVVNGVLKLRPPEKEKYAVYRNYVLCSSIEHSKQDYENVEISKEDEEQIKEFANNPEVYEMLIGSVAPHIYGHEDIKEAIILQLFGGVRKILEQKSKIRGNIHILLMGDPGLGKTQVLLYATQIAPKSIYVAGKTTSGAGLCVGKDSLVFVDNKMIKIKDLVEEQLKKGYIVDKNDNKFAKSTITQKTKSYNIQQNQIEDSNIINYVKIPVKEDLVRIIDETGLELITTKNTPVLVNKNGTKKYVIAQKLKVGDSLITTKLYPKINNNILLSKIKSISKCKDNFVYDFTVDKHHNFFANGFLVHNTATAVKDEFGEGGWTLKAGALVLASGGFAMVDEFDKMDPEDRSAMHEALEQETVSIAKAGIVTSFKTETTVLAAANPKYGRFDSYKTIPEQIDVPPTLLSRFDLFFVMKDTIDEKRDTETVASILRTHKSGELLQKEKIANLSSKDQGILEKIKDKPKISPDFIKKYISYARTKIFPVLADSASKDLQKFFINLRQKSQAGRVTVTYRQLEGLIRLSEASARVRLSETVTDADVERAINLYKKSMEQVGLDPESGAFDIDIITTGQSHSTTSKMMKVADIIANIVREQKGAPAKLEKVVEESEKEGIDKTKVKELIDKLQKTGDIYEPKVYHYIPTKKEQ